jgi:membrane-associated protease RseP (regulator of RpoE activity)
VTVTDAGGRRYSLDVLASSTCDAAHLYVAHAKAHPEVNLPVPTPTTAFEIVIGGKVYSVTGTTLQRWIERRRQEWKGPKGMLFRQRPDF